MKRFLKIKTITLLILLTGFQLRTQAAICDRLGKKYEIKLIATPTSPIKEPFPVYNLMIFNKTGPKEYSSFIKNTQTKESLNDTLSKDCNNLSFKLPFTFNDKKGFTGIIGAIYQLDYNCNVSIRNRTGTFIGNCLYKNEHIGNIQLIDSIDVYGTPVLKRN